MSKIIGVTVGTTISPKRVEEKIKPVKTVNRQSPDENGNVEVIGNNGKDGVDGVSPTVTTSKSGKVTTITITDKNGTKTATINDGTDGTNGTNGKDGTNGTNGTDGVSPTVTTSKSGKVTTIKITDKNGTKTATINDGADGTNGTNGTNGKDGTSVTVSNVSESTASGGTNTVTFSDGKKINIKNGVNGSNGTNGTNGTNGKDGTSVTITNITESSASGGTNTVTFSDGKTLSIKNGKDGKDGEGGSGIGNDPIVIGDSDGQHTRVDIGSITLAEGEEYQVNLIGSTTDDLDECLLLEGKSGNDVQLRGLLSPTANNDAATKAYVDGKVTKSGVGLGNVDNVKQYSASNPPPYPVTSVNGKTGAVTLTNETWTFTLANGSTVTKKVVLG